MGTSRSSISLMLVTAGSKVPIFTGRPTDLKPWPMALKKKQRVHDLTDAELINLAYDYSDGIVSEWIGSYLDDHPDTSTKTLFDKIIAQYGEFIKPADAARALIKVTQGRNESLAELASRMSSLARMAYKDSELREGSAVQVQLAEFFIDGINNSFIKEDVARANPKTLSEALSSARESERLYERLRSCREKEKTNNKFSGRNYWRQEGIGSHTVLREPKVEAYHRKWAGECHGCYSCRQPVHKKGNAPSQQECWNCDEQKCPRSEGGNVTYSTSGKRKTKTTAQTKSHKTNHIQSLKKEKNKVTLAPKIKTNSKDSCLTREMVNSSNKKRAEEYELFTQGSDMMCRVDIMGKQVKALIDSGSEVSLLKSLIFKGLKNSKMKLKGSDLTVTQANGQKMRLNGMIHLHIKIGKIETGSTLYIAPDLEQTMILGGDWLKINKAQLCFNPNRLTIKGVEIPLGSKTSGETKIYTVDSVKLPPRTAISCAAKLILSELNEENLYQAISTEEVIPEEEEIVLVESIVKENEKGKIPVMLANLGNRTISVPKGERLGRVAPIRIRKQVKYIEKRPIKRSETTIDPRDINVPNEHRQKIEDLIQENIDVVANSDKELGRTQSVQMKIDTGNNPPLKIKPYRTPIHKRKLVEEPVKEMLEAKVIERSRSPWSFPIVVVDKKDGEHRFCVDFTALNNITKPLAYSLPLIDDILALLGKATCFSTLDLRSGYWQVALDQADREKAAFVCHSGLFQFRVMPFGFANAPGVFQQLMSIVFGGLEGFSMAYIDDILFSRAALMNISNTFRQCLTS